MRVLAVVNQKGGVGKTTTAVNLAAALAVAERPTLLVDFDPQTNATAGVWIDRATLTGPTIYEVFLEGADAKGACRPTTLPYLSLLPGSADLVGADLELVEVVGRESRLRQALTGLEGEFAFVLVDCPPSLGLLTVNALVAADSAVVPLQCEYYALEGLAHLMRTLDLVRDRANPRLGVEGIVFTMFDGRTSLALQVRSEVERYFRDHLFRTVIPRNVRLTEAPSHSRSIVQYDLRSPGAVAYLELAKEVLAHDEARARPRARGATATG
ncbi:MAG: ParA family protein [Candidatus Rokuibacteriota bacterium]